MQQMATNISAQGTQLQGLVDAAHPFSDTTPGHLGIDILAELNQLTAIVEYPMVTDLPPLLSSDQLSLLSSIKREDEMVRFVTPFLWSAMGINTSPSAPASPIVLVNSETFPWLENRNAPFPDPNLRKKPDLFLAYSCAVHSKLKKFSDRTTTSDLNPLPGTIAHAVKSDGNYIYGIGAHRSLQIDRCVVGCVAAKLSTSATAFGELCKYQRLLPGVALGVLITCTDIWLYKTMDGIPHDLTKLRWDDPGSKDAVLSFFSDHPVPPLISVLRILLKELEVVLTENSFLGAGTTGRAFRVRTHDGVEMALKVVVDSVVGSVSLINLQSEYVKMVGVNNLSKHVAKIRVGSLIIIDGKGGGFLVEDVGENFEVKKIDRCIKVLESLVDLHRNNVYHGDARLSNLLDKIPGSNLLKWIDFRLSVLGTNPSSSHFLDDASTLCESIMRCGVKDPKFNVVQERLLSYSTSLSDESLTQLAESIGAALEW
jgi:hypothetical protein